VLRSLSVCLSSCVYMSLLLTLCCTVFFKKSRCTQSTAEATMQYAHRVIEFFYSCLCCTLTLSAVKRLCVRAIERVHTAVCICCVHTYTHSSSKKFLLLNVVELLPISLLLVVQHSSTSFSLLLLCTTTTVHTAEYIYYIWKVCTYSE